MLTAGEAVYKAVEANARKSPHFDEEEWKAWEDLSKAERLGWGVIAHTAIGWYKQHNVVVVDQGEEINTEKALNGS